jgi:vacuolar-type H+-ATPase subunit E/Vma4
MSNEEQRDAEIVAAIAELRQEVERCKNRYDKLIPREFAETNRDRIAKLKENHQNKLDKMQAQIDALEKRIDFHAVNNPLNGNPDDISLHELISVVDQRCALIEQVLGGMTEEATFEKIDKLTEAVLMSLDHHKAVERGMKMWGSGDFERMANKLREGKEKGENNARL